MREPVRSIHPYEPYIPADATKLIVGTMPPFRFCAAGGRKLYETDVDFYYGSRDNAFWKLLSEVTGVPLDFAPTPAAVAQRKELLTRLHMGITDVVGSCIHRDGKSDDGSLLDIQPKPLNQLLLDYPRITELIYTGRTEVKRLVNQYFADKSPRRRTADAPPGEYVRINGKAYAVTRLYSPSPIALWSVSADTRREQYRKVFSLCEPANSQD